jgi:hypothetical protein
MFFRVLSIILIFSVAIWGKNNISLSKVLIRFQGGEYNMLLSPKQVVLTGKKKKTRKAINKGYKRAIAELKRQVQIRGMSFNLKIFTSSGSGLPQYEEKDIKTYGILKEMLNQQASIREQLFDETIQPVQSTQATATATATADSVDMDMDLGDDAFDISDDEASIKKDDGKILNISPAEAFTAGFLELSELYNQSVIQLSKALHPFKIKGRVAMRNVHSVFGIVFFPSKHGSIKQMRMYVVLCNINTENDQSVQIIVKEIPNFKWDRNYLYISAATGKILKQIVSGVLGKPLLIIGH